MILIDLLIINAIMVLIHESGFIEHLDSWVESKWRFHHLPFPVRCLLCGTFWLSMLYIIITPGAFTLLNVCLCLVNAHLTEITQGIWRTLRTGVMDLIGWISDRL